MAKIQLAGYLCDRCEHTWVPREDTDYPKVCPKCKSPYWDTPRKDYATFRDTIAEILSASGEPMTWTQVRNEAKLPQKFPNNKWVHKMEQDIGLVREKLSNGTTLWKLDEEQRA